MKFVEGCADIPDIGAFLDEIEAIADEHDCTVQAFDARLVAGERHLESAVEHADRAFERGENVARDRGVEILLYAAGRRQIDRALELGVDEGENAVVAVVDGGDESGAADALAQLLTPADTLGPEHADEARIEAFFDVTEAERAATAATLSDLVCERVALLDVDK